MSFVAVIKAEFTASLLQSSVSHNPSEIILICRFAAKKHFLSSMLKTVVLLHVFEETVTLFSLTDKWKVHQLKQHLFLNVNLITM